MRVAVTGASGFVGRRLLPRLAGEGVELRALVRDPSRAGAGAMRWDLTMGGDERAFEGVEALVHLAAYVPQAMGSAAELEACMQANVLGTQRLLDAALQAGVRHVVHVSTGNAYRMQPRAVVEDDPLYPSARAPYYLASKLAGEVLADHVGRSGRASVAILRPSAVYGPGMAAGGLVPTLASRLRTGQRVSLQDGGRYQADLVFVDDVAAAIASAVVRRASGAFNVGSGRATTSRELAQALVALTGADPEAVELVGATEGPALAGFSPLDIGRAARELRYVPTPLEAGLRAYLASL